MSKIPVVVVGPFGKKLGRPVCEALLASDEFELVAGVVSPDDDGTRNQRLPDVQLVKSIDQIEGEISILSDQLIQDHLVEAVVFYAVKADALSGRIGEALDRELYRHVIGTTGLSVVQKDKIDYLSADDVIVHAPNFSLGANVGAEQCADLATRFPDYHAEIVEAHHWQKSDAPSGTAKMWARVIAVARGLDPNQVVKCGRNGDLGVRNPDEIWVSSVRGGSVTGYHKATFYGPNDEIAIEHNVRSSALFAQGALQTIRWAAQDDRQPGFYGMPHVLGLKRLIELGLT